MACQHSERAGPRKRGQSRSSALLFLHAAGFVGFLAHLVELVLGLLLALGVLLAEISALLLLLLGRAALALLLRFVCHGGSPCSPGRQRLRRLIVLRAAGPF